MEIKKRILINLMFVLALSITAMAQENNLNLITPQNNITLSVSSSSEPFYGASNIASERLQVRWETVSEKEGAWIKIDWETPQKIKELWIVNKSTPYDFDLHTYTTDGNYLVPQNVNIEFSDGTSVNAELRLCDYYQIITLPETMVTSSLRIIIEKLWEGSGALNTGLCKVKAFSEPVLANVKVDIYDMYEIKDSELKQSAKIEIVNPGNEIKGANLSVIKDGKTLGMQQLETIPAKSVTTQQIWFPIVYSDSKLTFKISSLKDKFNVQQSVDVKPYQKNYFDGGAFNILSTNHNDLGWLNTQSITADFRSEKLIIPAIELMKKDPDFKYTMESIEYLKEFLVRHPEREEEIARLMAEKRFIFGASYVQCLQGHVGREKLIRQFYLGRRWFLENFPGCDTKLYINTDVPGFTYQLPQILKKSGVDYVLQGRMPWGFYYWEGLDGTSIPMFVFRYAWPEGLMNPVNNTGWLKFCNEREYYYKPRQLPKKMIYDFNTDYFPPCPALLPFVKKQNMVMKKYAEEYNKRFKDDTTKHISPPKINHVEAESAIREVFEEGTLNIETIKGEWPLSWAYYDEPGNREALLMGRLGHNKLLKSESLFSLINTLGHPNDYPKDKIDAGWLANCWPDHGWGGNRGVVTDSNYMASYQKSLQIGNDLINSAGELVLSLAPQSDKSNMNVVIYNSVNWTRTEIATCKIVYPKEWKGMELKDENGNSVPFEIISHSNGEHSIEIAFVVDDIPGFGFKTYYATVSESFPKGYVEIDDDSVENDMVKVTFGSGGITSLYDKVSKKEILRTDKFFGGEVIQMTAPGAAWEFHSLVNMDDFDKTSRHEFKTISAVESPIRYIIEKEAEFKYFTLRERFILNKHSRELIVEADILNWTGEIEKELRIVFPVDMDKSFRASYEIPFGTVEMGRDEIDYSYLPDNYESQFKDAYTRKDLPFREAINWVDISSDKYKGNGCLFASDITLHIFRDETENPVDYPIVQHVLLSSRKSLAWNPVNWFTQAGNHKYRMALYPHEGNWRFAYKNGIAFNSPLVTWCGQNKTAPGNVTLPLSQSLISVAPSNLIVSAVKQAEDGDGLFVRFYEAEGRYTKAIIKGFQPFSKVYLTDMLEYDIEEIPVKPDGSIEISVKPWEIVNIKLKE